MTEYALKKKGIIHPRFLVCRLDYVNGRKRYAPLKQEDFRSNEFLDYITNMVRDSEIKKDAALEFYSESDIDGYECIQRLQELISYFFVPLENGSIQLKIKENDIGAFSTVTGI